MYMHELKQYDYAAVILNWLPQNMPLHNVKVVVWCAVSE
jgi:hypothetical protein